MNKLLVALVCVVPVLVGRSQARSGENTGPMPISLEHAHSVYLTSPSGDELGMFPMPEDKEALIATRRVIRGEHRLKLVFAPNQADLIVLVSGQPAKDTIKVFDSRDRKKCLWHRSERNGLRSKDAPLAKTFESEFEKATSQQEIPTIASGH